MELRMLVMLGLDKAGRTLEELTGSSDRGPSGNLGLTS